MIRSSSLKHGINGKVKFEKLLYVMAHHKEKLEE